MLEENIYLERKRWTLEQKNRQIGQEKEHLERNNCDLQETIRKHEEYSSELVEKWRHEHKKVLVRQTVKLIEN